MKKILLLAALFLSLTMNACQCAGPPPVGPTEEEGQAATTALPAAPDRA